MNLSVYNILGARIVTLMSGLQQPGMHVCSWDATLKPSGVYLLRLETDEDIVVMKVMMVK